MVVGEVNLETDVVVIGGGPGGYVAAIRAAELAVATPDGSVRYTARRGIVIATGARPQPVAVLRPDGNRVLSATDAVFLDRLPATVAVVGADYVAVELAVALRKLGSAVTLLGAGHHLLPEVDAALVPLAERGLRRLGVQWRREARPLGLTDAGVRLVRGEAQEE